ncbi:MAG: hypothetical protein ABI051_01665 [Vicinamibacterales bacterium]
MRKISAVLTLAAVLGVGCNRTPESKIDKAPVGSDVELTRQDGALVAGKLAAKDDQVLRVKTGDTTRSIRRADVADLRVKGETTRADEPMKATFREVTVPASTSIAVRLSTAISSERSRLEDTVRAELAEPVMIDGDQILPAGADIVGTVTRANPAGKVKGRASLGVEFTSVTAGGHTYPIEARFERVAPATKKADAEKIGIPAAGGAVIGAILGGKKGAAIGAAAGGGAGAAVVLSTPGQPVSLPIGTVLSLTLGKPIETRVSLK